MGHKGWIKLHRTIMDSPSWLAEPFTRGQAWVDLLLLANHRRGHIRKRGILIAVERGQIGLSEEALAARWQWSRGKVRRYIAELERDAAISRKISEKTVPKKTSVSSLLHIENYDRYQLDGTEDGTEDGRKTVPEQEYKEEKEIYSPSFLTFWSAYPRKVGKDTAWRAWQKRNGDLPQIEVILSAIERQKQSDQWREAQGKFIPHPATWINGGRWADEVPEPSAQRPTPAPGVRPVTCPACGRTVLPTDMAGPVCILCHGEVRANA